MWKNAWVNICNVFGFDDVRETIIGNNTTCFPTYRHICVFSGDVEGSLEALTDILRTYRYPLCELNVVHSGVGNVSLTDVQVAETFHGEADQTL